jgi:hypothetical protein
MSQHQLEVLYVLAQAEARMEEAVGGLTLYKCLLQAAASWTGTSGCIRMD